MRPTLSPADTVLINPRAYRHSVPSPGDIVLAEHPYLLHTKILKRVKHIDGDGRVFMVGDNPSESTDSRAFGSLATKSIVGRVVSRFP